MSQLTRKAIMKCTLELAEKKSLKKITIKDIADECGITRSTFYYHFSDIYDVLDGVVQAKIDEFNVRLNIPKTLKDFGINEEEFKEKVDKIAELAVGDACTGSNPRAIDPAAMAKLLTCTYYGTEVDF